ncbi:MAG: hypothetical protein NZ551_01980 [Microscillaceae bacterium]|nr:hypothetical protein [Microscillaceae bacterium]MDW8459955.1 hypothetical protein [Cytophagales bacterium]
MLAYYKEILNLSFFWAFLLPSLLCKEGKRAGFAGLRLRFGAPHQALRACPFNP